MNKLKVLSSIARDTIKDYGWPVSIVCFALTPLILLGWGFCILIDWVQKPIEAGIDAIKKARGE